MAAVRVAVLATLDSKVEVVRFLLDRLRAAGVEPWLVDLSLRRHEHALADITGEDVARASGTSWQALAALGRADAAEAILGGATKLVATEVDGGGIGGVIGVGGANGSTMACAIMRALPLGLPKVMVTPVAATAAVQWYVAASDIAMYPTIGDISLNRITQRAIANAAEAVAGMAKSEAMPGDGARRDGPPLIGLSSFGNLQPAVERITAGLEARGYEVMQLHASGPGGRALETLAAAGELAGVIDLTTSEMVDDLTGGVYSAGPDRLRAAGKVGIPQVVVPGCMDFSNWWIGQVPDRYRDRAFVQYNVEILLMRTSTDEMAELGKRMGERLAAATGPVQVLLPMRGFSGLTGRMMHSLGGGDRGAWADPAIDRKLVEALRQYLPAHKLRLLDLHINAPEFADACVAALVEQVHR